MPASDYARMMKALLDRICAHEGISRGTLAKELGIHPQTLSQQAYRGDISFELIMKIIRRAQATPEEFAQLELAWLRTKTGRIRDQAMSRALEIIDTLMKELEDVEAWMKRRKQLEAYLKWRRLPPLEKRGEVKLADED